MNPRLKAILLSYNLDAWRLESTVGVTGLYVLKTKEPNEALLKELNDALDGPYFIRWARLEDEWIPESCSDCGWTQETPDDSHGHCQGRT